MAASVPVPMRAARPLPGSPGARSVSTGDGRWLSAKMVTGAPRVLGPRHRSLSVASGGDLDDHVGRLDHADDLLAGGEVELIDGLPRDETDESMGACLDLDHGRDRILADRHHHPREPVARTLGDDRPVEACPLRSAARIATSARFTVRCPPAVRSDGSRPLWAQRLTVSGLTPSDLSSLTEPQAISIPSGGAHRARDYRARPSDCLAKVHTHVNHHPTSPHISLASGRHRAPLPCLPLLHGCLPGRGRILIPAPVPSSAGAVRIDREAGVPGSVQEEW